jgi:uncharacterized protein
MKSLFAPLSLALLLSLGLAASSRASVQDTNPTPPAAKTTESDKDKDKVALIRRLIGITGESRTAIKQMKASLAAQRELRSEVPVAFWEKLEEAITEDDLMQLFIPIYDKHYTTDEINGLIAFYETPLGQKITTQALTIQKESMAAGEELGKRKAMEVLAEMGIKPPSETDKPAPKTKPKASSAKPSSSKKKKR